MELRPLIHRFAALGVEAALIIKRLEKEPDVTIRRALILSLGEYSEKEWSADDRIAVTKTLQEIFRAASDPGLHAASEWLLRKWKEEAWLKKTDDEWAKDKEHAEKARRAALALGAKPHWYVNGQGQTMVVIPGPVKFLMGSPPTETSRFEWEPQHKKRIGRTLTLAAKLVTVEQYRRYEKDFLMPAIYSRTADLPVVGTTWYQAATYCNWLSKEEGIDPKEWCYEGNGQALKLRKNYLRLSGYRLPTETEIEFAARAGALTSRYYGETEELLPNYAWYTKNSKERTWPVGSLKPNDLGFFDVLGNAFTWCQERYMTYPKRVDEETEDNEDASVIVPVESRVLRGGSFTSQAPNVRSAFRSNNVPSSLSGAYGFRVARTLRLDGGR